MIAFLIGFMFYVATGVLLALGHRAAADWCILIMLFAFTWDGWRRKR